MDTHLGKICAHLAPKTLATHRTIANACLPAFGSRIVTDIHSCDVEDFIALMLKECSPADVNACVRTMKALMNHAMRRRVTSSSHLRQDSAAGLSG